ncbi:MAG: zinc dependent phospholipase C family protein [Candidatus Krumholzibacteria bacterium]
MRLAVPPALAFLAVVVPWGNGGNSDLATECSDPPYATHDWIADHALDMLPASESAWLQPHKTLYLLGTEAPDHSRISTACNTPHRGYGDTGGGHSVDWNAGHTEMVEDRSAVRAAEEYSKAVIAFEQGNPAHAAFFLGAMAHYIGDVSQYGHVFPDEVFHQTYENFIGTAPTVSAKVCSRTT